MLTATKLCHTRPLALLVASLTTASLLAVPAASLAFDVALAWDRVDDAAGYHVFIRYNQETLVDTPDVDTGDTPTVTTIVEKPLIVPAQQAGADGLVRYTVTGLPLGPTVVFSVSAFDADDESAHSNELSIRYLDAAEVVDSDGDGLVDADEDINLNGTVDEGETDPQDDDSDDDGMTDGDEVIFNGTDPLDSDSDADGIIDSLDTCHDLDGDGFGAPGVLELTCPLDNCVMVANPEQLDSDFDGLGQPCDPCTNVAGGRDIATKAKVVLRRIGLDTVAGDDELRVNGDFSLPDGAKFASLDPGLHGARVLVTSADGGVSADIEIPPGALTGGRGGHGWRTDRRRKTWKYLDKRKATVGGITKLVFKHMARKAPNLVRLVVKGKRASYPVDIADSPVQAAVVLGGIEASMAGHCGETHFERSHCQFVRGNRNLSCKL